MEDKLSTGSERTGFSNSPHNLWVTGPPAPRASWKEPHHTGGCAPSEDTHQKKPLYWDRCRRFCTTNQSFCALLGCFFSLYASLRIIRGKKKELKKKDMAIYCLCRSFSNSGCVVQGATFFCSICKSAAAGGSVTLNDRVSERNEWDKQRRR